MSTDPLRIDNSADDSWQKLAKDLFGIDLSRQDDADDLDIDAFLPISGKAAPSHPEAKPEPPTATESPAVAAAESAETVEARSEPDGSDGPQEVTQSPVAATTAGWADDDDFGAGLDLPAPPRSESPRRPAPTASRPAPREPASPRRAPEEAGRSPRESQGAGSKPTEPAKAIGERRGGELAESPAPEKPAEPKPSEPKPAERDTFWDPLAEWNWDESSSTSTPREGASRERGSGRGDEGRGEGRGGRGRDGGRRGDAERRPSSRDRDVERQERPAASRSVEPAAEAPPPYRDRGDRGERGEREPRPHERRERRDHRISEMSREARPVEPQREEAIPESSVHRPRPERGEPPGAGRGGPRRADRAEEPRGEALARRERGPQRDRPEPPRREPVASDEFGSGMGEPEPLEEESRGGIESGERGRRRRRRRRGPSEREAAPPSAFADDEDIFSETPADVRDIAAEPASFEEDPIVPPRSRGRDRGPRRGEASRRGEGERRPSREAPPPARESRFEADEFSEPTSTSWDEPEEAEVEPVAEYQDLPTWEEAISYLLNPNYGASSGEPDLGPARSAHTRTDRPPRSQPPRGRRRR